MKVLAARRSSTSQSATMFSVGAAAADVAAPCPPEPMAAKFSFSLGDLYPAAFNDGVLPNPAGRNSAGQQAAIEEVTP